MVEDLMQLTFKECGLTVDLCEYSANPDACKDWLDKNHPEFYSKLKALQSKPTVISRHDSFYKSKTIDPFL